ncbi:SusC/RagA family TonB-linked outer membrane protein [Flaviramulus sp. BrNp1-15]|uniref:SusC/RagA family TonB-linked outer membrane protein n=1 Tax=Flaviramulus sp. BrNp1-15 TaxID=2916754 RepID=UPI001EE98C73|nr:SusC/RagA family TonB-linked outer membrane protein [Flaviramulus sp. BrNp1-15]ULC59639.1 SusC/RagA family TonB-linked outer membrane protein [Flaviramulus sp. BrNp1-15]
MKKKTTLSFLVFFTAAFSLLFSQNITVIGTVTDASSVPLPGVNIQVKETKNGTSTDFDGNYQISAKQGDVLIFSFLGFKTKEITVKGTTLNVSLEESTDSLDEVVVTAFGIQRETRELGYSVTQVKTEDINLAGQSNPIAGLQGRVAGVQINQTSGTSGGGIDILIRGITSMNPDRDNQPLIIVDGLALNNDTFAGSVLPSAGSNSPSSAEQFSFTNRAADINPEDVESFNVLKGAAATALYGVRAANGAIIITTKKGKSGKAKINITASTSFRNINKTPDLQTTYREGFSGLPRTLYTPETDSGFTRLGGTSFYSWGPKYSDNSATLDDDTVVDLSGDQFYSPYDLFRTGVNTQVNFNISGASDKLDYFFSVGNNSEEGVLPNTDYNKTTLRFKSGYKVTDDFNINTSIAYTNAGGNRANGGDKSVFSSLSYYSGTFPINDYQNTNGSQRNYSFGVIDNPRYFLEKSPLTDDVNRWVGNITLNWAPKDWINVTYAAQVDNYSDKRNRFIPPDLDTGTQVGGFIVNQNINFLALESNLLVALTKEWSEDFKTTLTLGNQVSDSKRDYSFVRGETLNVPGINDLANTINTFGGNSITQLRNVGVFGELKMDYKNKLFLTVTGRNDWISTLPQQNRSFFYPSVSLAYDVNALFDKDSDFFTFGKLRASWAEVGKGPLFGQVGQYFIVDGNFPFGGAGGYRASTLLGDTNIKPERNRSIEFGADLRFFNNKVRLDYAYYKTRVKDQIFTQGTAYSTGLSGIVRNAGDFETFGHELLLSANIIKTENFTWETILNWSTNEGKVLSLPEDIESLIFADAGFAGVTSEIRDGDKLGTLYGYKWVYENGERYIGDDGLPRVDLEERVKVGNAFPDFIASIGNNLSYKNLSFNFLLEWKEGGDLYDSGRRNGLRNGILGVTEFRDVTTVLDGVMDDGNGGFVTNNQEVLIDQNYYRSSTRYNRASEILVQDASWVKLRNIGLSYNFQGNILETLHLDNLSVSVSAQNILIWTPWDGYDPEGNQYSAGSNVYGFTGLSTPISESYSFGVKLGF